MTGGSELKYFGPYYGQRTVNIPVTLWYDCCSVCTATEKFLPRQRRKQKYTQNIYVQKDNNRGNVHIT